MNGKGVLSILLFLGAFSIAMLSSDYWSAFSPVQGQFAATVALLPSSPSSAATQPLSTSKFTDLSATGMSADTQCPKPGPSEGYNGRYAYKQKYMEGTVVKTNLYYKECEDTRSTVKVIGYCTDAQKCCGKQYKDVVSGEWKTFTQECGTASGASGSTFAAAQGTQIPGASFKDINSAIKEPASTGGRADSVRENAVLKETAGASRNAPTFRDPVPASQPNQTAGGSGTPEPKASSQVTVPGASFAGASTQASVPGTNKLTGPAFTPGGAQLALGTPPAGSGGPLPSALQQRPGIPLTPSIAAPTLPRPQNTFGNVITGLPVSPPAYDTRPSGRSSRTSLFSFIPNIPSFSPVVYLNQATQFVQTIITPPTTRVVVVAPPAVRAPSSRQPTNIVSVVSLSPASIDIVASSRGESAPSHSGGPTSGIGLSIEGETEIPSPSEAVSNSEALSNFLALQTAPDTGFERGPRSRVDIFAGGPDDTFRASPQQVVLFPQASFEARGNAPANSFSTGEDAHAVSIIDLLSAVMTGSFSEVMRAVGRGGAAERAVDFEQQNNVLALDVERRTSSSFASDVETQNVSPLRAPQIRVPELPKPAWNPALGISEVITPSVVSVPPPRTFAPLLPVPEASPEPLPEQKQPNPVDRILAKVEGFFRSAFGWLRRGKGEPTSSMSASREGDASVRLLADPPRAQTGTHTTLYWTSSGVDDCTVLTSDGAQIGNGPEGTTLTPKIITDSTFSATCTGGGQTVQTSVRVRVE